MLSDWTESDLEEQVKSLIQTVDDFSLPFCQLKLRQLLELEQTPQSGCGDNAQLRVVAALFEGAKAAVVGKNTAWPILLSVIDDGIVCQVCLSTLCSSGSPQLTRSQIREQAEEHLFSSMLTLNPSQSYNDDALELSKRDGEIYLSIIKALAYTILDKGAPQIGQIMTDKMNALAQSLQHFTLSTKSRHSSELTTNKHDQCFLYDCFW